MGLHLDTSKLYCNEAEEATFKKKKKGFFSDVAKASTVWLNSPSDLIRVGRPLEKISKPSQLMSLKLNLYTVYTIFAACENIY